MSISPRYAANSFGNGPVVIELYLDYVCRFSKKMFTVLYDDVLPNVDQNKFKFIFRHQVQSWHPSSTLVHEAGIAVSLLGKDKDFWTFSKALFDHSEEYYDEPVYNETRAQTYQRLAELVAANSSVSKDQFLDVVAIKGTEPKNGGNKLQNDFKQFVKTGRQNSIHVSPTVLINGVVDNQISSSWDAKQWLEKLNSTDEAVTANL
uniref:ARAD1B11990p n=1 Tax=Blastobotrys adeninivorans TaxID=409370 RepID=A0A060TB17_BLAAD